jgi:hypothetical protein
MATDRNPYPLQPPPERAASNDELERRMTRTPPAPARWISNTGDPNLGLKRQAQISREKPDSFDFQTPAKGRVGPKF